MPLKLLPLAAANPPMTVDPCDAFVLQVSRNPLGLTDIPVFVDARPHTWMLDPTAPFNLIARSIAREVGLKISERPLPFTRSPARPMQVHSTVIPRFTVGGRLTFHNMTAFVFEDARLRVYANEIPGAGRAGISGIVGSEQPDDHR